MSVQLHASAVLPRSNPVTHGLRSVSGGTEKEKNPLLLSGIESRFPGRQILRLLNLTTTNSNLIEMTNKMQLCRTIYYSTVP